MSRRRRGGKILKLDSLMLESEETLEDRQGKILMLDSEEDRKILMKVKSEEGKILKLKEYMAASEKALAGLSFYIEPMVKPAKPDAKMKDLFTYEKFSVKISHRCSVRC
jgi:hypothetical protein